ncbi:MAG: hypothetical protein MSA56_06200 [Clostridium sp.]|nr:hypothetical protein [Clostridium sp.]
MPTDYELFLSGCYGAVVEINYENDDIYKFMDLMDDLGFKTYVNWLRQIDEKHGIISNAKYNGIKHLCMEYQMGKGFTYGEKQEYLDSCEETKVLSLEDLIKSVGKEEDFFLDYKEIDLVKVGGDSTLEVLNDFCSMYDWLPVKCGKGFNIKDIQFENEFVEDECFETFTELVNRIVGRAINYYSNEMSWDEDDIDSQVNYGYELLAVAKKYIDKNNENDIKWLEYFEEDLKELEKESDNS